MKIDLRTVTTFIYTVDKSPYKERAIKLRDSLVNLGFWSVQFLYGELGPISPWIPRHTPWAKAVKTLTPPFIILEDDATITDAYKPEIEYPDDAQLVYLGGSCAGRPLSDEQKEGLIPSLGVQVYWPPMYYEEHDADWIRVRTMASCHAVLFVDSDSNISIVDALLNEKNAAVDVPLSHWIYDHRAYCRKFPFWYQNQPELPGRAIEHREYYLTTPRMTVSPIVIQTGRDQLDQRVVSQTIKHCRDFAYRYFTDEGIVAFFRENPLPEFPNIVRVFDSFRRGEHKADLFRYYFLYLRGGVFIDNDAMLTRNLSDTLGDCDLMLCDGLNPSYIFNGFIAARPRHPVIYQALRDAYHARPRVVNNKYLRLCRALRVISDPYRDKPTTKMLKEVKANNGAKATETSVLDSSREEVLHHWFGIGYVPKQAQLKWDDYSLVESQSFPLNLLATYRIPEGMSFIRIGRQGDGGYTIADPVDYDCIISGGYGRESSFEQEAVAKYEKECFAFDSRPVSKQSIPGIHWVQHEITRRRPLHRWIGPFNKLLVKMDIEGGEYGWIRGLSDMELNHISQLVMEVHFPFTSERWEVLERLSGIFALVHIHANNDRGLATIGKTCVPVVMELTYLNRRLFIGEPIQNESPQSFPMPFDFPNYPEKEDLYFTLP